MFVFLDLTFHQHDENKWNHVPGCFCMSARSSTRIATTKTVGRRRFSSLDLVEYDKRFGNIAATHVVLARSGQTKEYNTIAAGAYFL